MLMETQEKIKKRQVASRKWIEKYRNVGFPDQPDIGRALANVVLDPRTSDYLADHDPLTLWLAQKLLSGETAYGLDTNS